MDSLRCWLLAGTALLAIPAFATETQQPLGTGDTVKTATDAAAKVDGEEIVVTGTRPIAESEAAALAVQRESPSLVSVIAADSVGRLPDQNIAQAVSRLPGVSVERDQGQARYINLRGAPRQYTTISFNGINIVSPEGRDSRFDSIPSAIASQIIVRKAVTPDLTGETIAGNVDVVTRSAFDYSGLKVFGKLGVGKVQLGDRSEFEASLVGSNRWDTGIGEVGIVLSGTYYARGVNTDNFETDWETVSQDTRPNTTGEPRFWARETERKFYRATRRNYGGSARLDWRPTPDNRFFAETIYTAFKDDELRDNYIFDFDDQQTSAATVAALRLPCPPTAPTVPPPGTTGYADVCLNTPFVGTVFGPDINSNYLIRRFIQSIFTNTVGGDHEFGEGWKLRWRGNYTRSNDDFSVPAQFNFESPNFANVAQRPTVAYDLSNRDLSTVQLFRTTVTGTGATAQLGRGTAVASILDFAQPLTRIRSSVNNDLTKAYTGKFDLSKQTSFLGDTTFTVGVQYDQRTKSRLQVGIDFDPRAAAFAPAVAAAGIPTTIQAYADAGAYTGEIPPGYAFQYFNRATLLGARDRALTIQAPFEDRTQTYRVRERVTAGYAAALTRFDWGNVLAGVRVEHTSNRSSANAIVNNVITPITVNRSDTKVFPNVNVNIDVREDQKLRLTFSTGASRPDYDQLRPNVGISDSNRTISGGNPDAKAEYALGGDAYYEWYIQPRGYFAVGAFYKSLRDVLFGTSRQVGSDAFNFDGVDRSQYIFSTIANGGSGYIYGAEAALQLQLDPFIEGTSAPQWLGGFGFQANATVNRSRATAPDGSRVRLPGASDLVYNLTGYYEKYGLSVRASYQWRDDWIDSLQPLDSGGNAFWRADGELDISVRYAVTPNLEIYGDWANVLNGPGVRYTFSRPYTIEYEKFGSRLVAGVRVTF